MPDQLIKLCKILDSSFQLFLPRQEFNYLPDESLLSYGSKVDVLFEQTDMLYWKHATEVVWGKECTDLYSRLSVPKNSLNFLHNFVANWE